MELNKVDGAFGPESKHCPDVVGSVTLTHKHISHSDTLLL